MLFFHASQQSAGVAILLNKFKGNIIESLSSDEGRWIILVFKLNNTFFIVCNLYNYNNTALAKTMCTQLCKKLEALKLKYKEAHMILGGDYNDAPNDLIDRVPARTIQHSRFKGTEFICEQLSVIDVWRYLNFDIKDFTWSNTNRSLQSRIDLWLISSSCIHDFAPLSDHKLITIHLIGNKPKQRNLRGFWKLNNDLLDDDMFCNIVKKNSRTDFWGYQNESHTEMGIL